MKLGIRTGAVIVAIAAMAAASLIYLASNRISMAGETATESRGATLQTFRVAQALKSLIHGYELTINEYYSTVLEFPVYQKKAEELKTAIDSELATLKTLNTGDATATADLDAAFKDIETLRLELEGALAGESKNWDLAREALFKLNVVSIRAVQPADRIARIAGENAVSMDTVWQNQQSQARNMMMLAMALVLIAGILSVVAAFGGGQPKKVEA